jgi:hypothetical protein
VFIPYSEQVAVEIRSVELVPELRKIFKRVGGWQDVNAPGRDLWVTPIHSAYEFAAGFAIAINGSPPRGCIIALGNEDYRVFCSGDLFDGKMRRLSPRDARTVRDFLKSNGFECGRVSEMVPKVCRWKSVKDA